MPFFTVQSRVNASVLRHLGNARVLIAGVEGVGIFRNPSMTVAMGLGAADTRPTIIVDSSTVPDAPVDTVIDIDGEPYSILAADPDGTGLTELRVERTQ